MFGEDKSSLHLVIVGGGIVGASCGLFALQSGWNVTLVNAGGPNTAASFGNAGVIALSECVPIGTPGTIASVPGMLLSKDSPLRIRPGYLLRIFPWLWRMLRVSTPAQVERIASALSTLLGAALDAHLSLAEQAHVRSSIQPSGWLKVYETSSAFKAAAGEYTLMRRHGVTCTELDVAGIGALEPALAPLFSNAIFHPACQHVGDPAVYVAALVNEFIRRGGEVVAASVDDIVSKANRITGVSTSDGVISCDAAILAGGAWSSSLARKLGARVPLDTERGYHMMFDAQQAAGLTRSVLWTDKGVVLSPMGDAVRVTSSVEFAGLHAPPDFSRVLKVAAHIREALPAITTEPVNPWLGFRPSMPDSLPVIGRSPGFSNAFMAFGHGHLGLTLGPVTGKLVVELLDGQEPAIDLAPFSPTRFH